MTHEKFLARRVLEQQREIERLRDQNKWLMVALAESAAIREVSAEQFSLLAAEPQVQQ